MKVLIVDDEPSIVNLIRMNLKLEGYDTVCAYSGREAVESYAAEKPDIVLLDIMLPDMEGYDVLRAIQELDRSAAVIFITANDKRTSKILGLELGADDYITKPFGVMELISRVKALLRRTSPSVPDTPLTLSGITLHPASRSCEAAGIPVELTYKEYELLSLLIRNAGIVLTRDVLMENVWGTDFIGESRTLDVHIKTLRRKLGDEGIHIKTVRNVGYLAEEKSSSIEEGEHQWLKK